MIAIKLSVLTSNYVGCLQVEENQIKQESTEGTFERTSAFFASYYHANKLLLCTTTNQLVLNKYIGLFKPLLIFIIGLDKLLN